MICKDTKYKDTKKRADLLKDRLLVSERGNHEKLLLKQTLHS
jgi:hypothetical protein